jgi:hypothetical protein
MCRVVRHSNRNKVSHCPFVLANIPPETVIFSQNPMLKPYHVVRHSYNGKLVTYSVYKNNVEFTQVSPPENRLTREEARCIAFLLNTSHARRTLRKLKREKK